MGLQNGIMEKITGFSSFSFGKLSAKKMLWEKFSPKEMASRIFFHPDGIWVFNMSHAVNISLVLYGKALEPGTNPLADE